MNKPIILNYGFPPEYLSTIKHFFSYGLFPVWFNASRNVAREKFLKRGTIDIKFFEIQMDKIEKYNNELTDTFSKCIIKTLQDDGTRLNPEEIFKFIQQNFG